MNWISRNDIPLPDDALVHQWAEHLEISPMLVALLWNRGINTIEDMNQFLNPSLQGLAPLKEWPGLLEAADVITSGLLEGKTLGIWGDYDVDGITSTALVSDFVKEAGFTCIPYIPNRLSEGYGINKEGLARLAEQGVNMLLTVDSGISEVDALTYAKELGMTVVISDHHLPGDVLPPADAIVNPRLAPCPCPSLAGVGVAFFLIAAVNNALHQKGYVKQDIRRLLDLVALGTLADVVNLSGQNRILVKNGLLQITAARRPGVAALKSVCNFSPSADLGAGQVVYSLAPRINAAGRLGSSDAALKLMLSENATEASTLAGSLAQMNQRRRDEEDKIYQSALEQAQEFADKGMSAFVLYSKDWHQGVIGIVASRILEVFHRPVVVATSTGTYLKGSGRSLGSFNIHEAFCQSADLLLAYGGHRMAAGLSLNPEQLKPFRERFHELATACFGDEEPTIACKIDAELPLHHAADFTFLKELELLQPFGSGNPEPVFASPPVIVRRVIQRPGFTMLDVTDEKTGITLRAKAWREVAHAMSGGQLKGQRIRIAYSPRIDRYNGAATVELRMKDWKLADEIVPKFSLALQ